MKNKCFSETKLSGSLTRGKKGKKTHVSYDIQPVLFSVQKKLWAKKKTCSDVTE